MGVAVLTVSALTDELAQLLTDAGIRAYAQAPAAFNAPGAVIDLDDPFITFDGTFSSVTMHFSLYLMTNPSPKWEDEVTVMVGKALNAFAGTGVRVDSIQLYDTVDIGNSRVFRGALLNIAVDVPLEEVK